MQATMVSLRRWFPLVLLLCSWSPLRAASVQAGQLAVFPMASVSVGESDLLVIGDAVRRELRNAGFQVMDAAEVAAALQKVNCYSAAAWSRESCIRAAARALGAAYAASVAVNAIGSLFEATVTLYSGRSGKSVWSGAFQVKGPVETFYKEAPSQIAAGLPKEVADDAPEPLPSAVTPHRHATLTPPSGEPGAEPAQPEPPAQPREAADNGISPSVSIGAAALFSLGSVEQHQSPYCFRAYALYPTSADRKSQVRLRVALPLYHNSDLEFAPERKWKYPDANINLEHEWGWSGFGIGVGLGYMYMQYFALEGEYETSLFPLDSTYRAYYDPFHAVNLSLNIRAGRPNAGFVGRFSWPLPFIFGDDEPDNYYLEYSAFGVFGGKHVRAGIGVTGMYKHREADRIRQGDATFKYEQADHGTYSRQNYYDYDLNNTSEFYLLVPCLRLAGLIGSHVVLGITFDLGGTVFPRSMSGSDSDWWRPSLGAEVLYSFGKLKGANLMDGSF